MSRRRSGRAGCRLLFCVVTGIPVLVSMAAASLTGSYGIELAYDDNPFKLSGTDLVEFRRSVNPARLPFRTADDLDVQSHARLAWRFNPTGRVILSTRLHQYLSNWQKSYGVGRVEVEQRLGRQATLTASCVFMPDYLIRYYRNAKTADTGDYAACRFSELLPGLVLQATLGPLRLQPGYRFELDDYVSEFDHYDTRIHRPGAVVAWSPVASFTVLAGYEYALARARGPTPDISHVEHALEATLTTRPERRPELFIAGKYAHTRRGYTTTDAGADPAHAGRRDVIESAGLEAGYDFGRAELRAGYEFEWRSVSSPFRSAIEDVKEYQRSRVTLGVVVRPGRKGR
uniref:DUF3570 domain-containing protein n=1 Tax=candidate division WOR-3 bacterium TaxID=2052148 RepID=A0A7C4GGV7_UNCW3